MDSEVNHIAKNVLKKFFGLNFKQLYANPSIRYRTFYTLPLYQSLRDKCNSSLV